MSTPFATGACERSSRTQNCCAEFSAHLHPGGGCVRRGRSRATTRANRAAPVCACVRAIGSNAWSARESNLDRAVRVRFAARVHDEAATKQGRTIHAANDRHYARVKESRVRPHAIRFGFLSNFRENSFFSLLEKCSRSYLNGARDYLLIRSSTSVR